MELRAAFPQNTDERLSYNVVKQQRLLALLRDDAGAEALSEYLIDWWIKREGRRPSFRRRTGQSFEALARLLVGVDAAQDTSQKRFLLWRMDHYIGQVETLIARQ